MKQRNRGLPTQPVDPTFGSNPLDAADEFDPEGWMAERPTYWFDLPDPEPPSRLAWLRHRAREAACRLGLAETPAERERVTQEEWIRLSEIALGPLPRPEKPRKKARPASPDAREPARKPKAYSPKPGGGSAA